MRKYLLLFMAAISCGGQKTIVFDSSSDPTIHYDVYISSDFPKPVDAIIRNSFAEWHKKLSIFVQFDYRNGYIDCLKTTNAICVEPTVNLKVAGLTTHTDQMHNALIQISADSYAPGLINWEECVSIISKHELGHALGLLDSKKSNTIMYFNGDNVARNITGSDVYDYLKMRGIVK
jgi:hypothetical protein